MENDAVKEHKLNFDNKYETNVIKLLTRRVEFQKIKRKSPTEKNGVNFNIN